MTSHKAGKAETFQWIETFIGELKLMSLQTDRSLQLSREPNGVSAISKGPTPNPFDGVRFDWSMDTEPQGSQ